MKQVTSVQMMRMNIKEDYMHILRCSQSNGFLALNMKSLQFKSDSSPWSPDYYTFDITKKDAIILGDYVRSRFAELCDDSLGTPSWDMSTGEILFSYVPNTEEEFAAVVSIAESNLTNATHDVVNWYYSGSILEINNQTNTQERRKSSRRFLTSYKMTAEDASVQTFTQNISAAIKKTLYGEIGEELVNEINHTVQNEQDNLLARAISIVAPRVNLICPYA